MITLAETILLAVKIREDSYDLKGSNKVLERSNDLYLDYNQFYKITIYEACKLAVDQNKCDISMIHLIYMLLINNWDESLTWARALIEG